MAAVTFVEVGDSISLGGTKRIIKGYVPGPASYTGAAGDVVNFPGDVDPGEGELLLAASAGLYPEWDGTNKKIIVKRGGLAAGTGTVTGATLDVVTGLDTIVSCVAGLGEDPGAGAGDVFQLTCVPHATPGTITVSIFQDDATAATEDTTFYWVATGLGAITLPATTDISAVKFDAWAIVNK